MNNFRVEIESVGGDVDIYTNATKINVNNDKVEVTYEDQNAVHVMENTEEITIKVNR